MSNIVAANQLGLSKIVSRKSTFLWIISNATHLKWKLHQSAMLTDLKYEIESPTFSSNPDDLKWCLVMSSSAFSPRSATEVNFEFKNKDSNHFKIDLSISITILSNSEYKPFKNVSNYCSMKQTAESAASGHHIWYFMKLNDLFGHKYLKNDELHILCEYELIPDFVNSQVLTFGDDSINKFILNKYEKQWMNSEFCDYELIAPCGRKLFVHRFILSAQSPVFYAMFKNDMKEKLNGSVKIEDSSYEVLKEMLRFMYAGKIEKFDLETIGGLMAAAQKYQIDYLQNFCKEFILKNLNIDNVVKTLRLCREYILDDLQEHVDAFVRSNSKLICENNPSIFNEKKSKSDCENNIYVKMIYTAARQESH